MSASGLIWTAATEKLYGYGAGHAHPSVEHIACPVCHAPAGSLCIGADGNPHLERHWRRAHDFTMLRRHTRIRTRFRMKTRRVQRWPSLELLPSTDLRACGYAGCQKHAAYILFGADDSPQVYCCYDHGYRFLQLHRWLNVPLR